MDISRHFGRDGRCCGGSWREEQSRAGGEGTRVKSSAPEIKSGTRTGEMDEGEIDFSDHDDVFFADCNDLPCTASMESFLDELLKNTHACTHTHTCNPPGPDNTHTHTCVHTHTQLFAPTEEDKSTDKSETQSDPSLSSRKKRPLGNREAVRKYREKKKAHTAYLEEQVIQLRALNQQLVRRLQGQAALEAEVLRLRSLLSEFRGRIEAELGSYPYQKTSPATVQKVGDGSLQPLGRGYSLNSFNVPCDADLACLHSSIGNEKHSATQHDQTEYVRFCVSCEVGMENCQGRKSEGNETQDGKNHNAVGFTHCVKTILPV